MLTQEELRERYPIIYPTQDSRCCINLFGLEIPDTWESTALTTLDEIEFYCKCMADQWVDLPEVCQVKEKFNGLRIYMSWTDSVIDQIIKEAEDSIERLGV
jgi:hypothetical protein